MKQARVLFACALFLVGGLAATNAEGALIFYTTRAAFDAANPGLPVEGFENANTGTMAFTGPLDAATNNAAFSPGDILPGIQFTDSPGADVNGMFVAGPGQSSNATTAVGQNSPAADALSILFNPGVTAVGFDIFQNFGGGSQSGVLQQYPVFVYDTTGALLGSTIVDVPSGMAGFFGVLSTTDLIGGVAVNNPNAFDVIDNVAFGAGTVPEPATLSLLGLGIALAARRRRAA